MRRIHTEGLNKPFWFWPFLFLKSGLWPFLIWAFGEIWSILVNFCVLWPFLAKKSGQLAIFEKQKWAEKWAKNWQKMPFLGYFWRFWPLFRVKMGVFGQNCEFVAKNPLFSLISCEKKLKILYSLRKKVGKWAEGEIRCKLWIAKITYAIMRDRY